MGQSEAGDRRRRNIAAPARRLSRRTGGYRGRPAGVGTSQARAVRMSKRLLQLRGELDQLLGALSHAESLWSPWLMAVAPEHRASARNLVHYWAIRQHDLRDLQRRLTAFGLSSLGRSEARVEATLRLVRSAVGAMTGTAWRPPDLADVPDEDGIHLLRRRAFDLLGPAPANRRTRIMVTLPSAAVSDPDLVLGLVAQGMNIARINCAHDDPEGWRAMAGHVRRAATATGRECRVAIDLAGPKLRTGPLQAGPRLIKLRPDRDVRGRVVAPARAWLTSSDCPVAAPETALVSLPVPHEWLGRRHDGEVLTVRDTRNARRRLSLTAMAGGFVVSTNHTTYLETGTTLIPEDADDQAELGLLPPIEQSLLLRPGDVLELTRDCSPAPVTSEGPMRIGCTLPEVFDCARVGEKVHFDDGRISGEVVASEPDVLPVRIIRAAPGGSRLRAGKGVNLPDTRLPVPALTDKDLADLPTLLELADIIGLSFVQDSADVARLLDEVERLSDGHHGIVLKIETQRAFQQLPQLLLTAMRRPRVGVMIARGDLAVECGYERLAELQEEILWLCEAAHLPVIWATQVLEQLAKSGQPSRAEISDAAMGERAECVMLNKGPFIKEAISVLDDVLQRMTAHHYKKTALLRSLRSWHPDTHHKQKVVP